MTFQIQFDPAPQPPGWLIAVESNGQLQANSGHGRLQQRVLTAVADLNVDGLIYIGSWLGAPVWLQPAQLRPTQAEATESLNLRALADTCCADEFALCARAMQLAHWRDTHQFCGRCGANTVLSKTELCFLCNQCGEAYFPRIAPCVIGVVARGDELLLASHHRHKAGRYSLLAGFIEAGESAEAAFAREVAEEVGVCIHNIRYVASQPWPYPSQLMLGFFADYLRGDFALDPTEILHANWFHPSALPDIPSNFSIAGKLIRAFLTERGYSTSHL